MSDSATLLRQVKIKTGVAKRFYKEHKTYILEEEQQKIKLDKLAAGDGEEWYIKNAQRMLEESNKMTINIAGKLSDAVQDLRQLLVAAEQDPSLKENTEVVKAKEVLEEVST